jgi:hypothetical protein
MAAHKRPTLAESGIDKLFHSAPDPQTSATPQQSPAPRPTAAPLATAVPSPASPRGAWDAAHRRRTFHCDNAVWDRLVVWCTENGVSHSAAITQALEAFLDDRGR